MAWYYGIYSCGHEGRVNIIGKHSERQWKIDRHFEGICEECKAKNREEANRQATKKASEYEFPDLKGTEKQIAWANTIRMDFYEFYTSNGIVVDGIIKNETDARFWIDNRTSIKSDHFINEYYKKQEAKDFNRQMINNDTVKPLEIKHDGVVEIVEKGNRICLYYEKDQDFIDLAKSMKYRWDGVWYRELSETTGNFSDRAAEIGHKLLKYGFCICIHDVDITNKAISGEYKSEHNRWIYSRKNSTLLAINWTGKNDELYQRARKIKGSKWDSPSVVVDVSHHDLIKEFAFENGFRFTKAAQKKIDDYVNQLAGIKEVTVCTNTK